MEKIEIINFEQRFSEDFARLNFEWLEKYFTIEDYDHKVLCNPKEYILDTGGFIFFAKMGQSIVGTVALIHREEGIFELSKMAVDPQFQGRRIGQKLMYHCINFAGHKNFTSLFLDSSRKLTPAITLYKKVGFKEVPVPNDSPYNRCDIRMELKI